MVILSDQTYILSMHKNKYVHIIANVTVSLQCIPFASLLAVSHVRRTLHTIICLFFQYHKY